MRSTTVRHGGARLAVILAAALAVAVAARLGVTLPGSPVPQTAQTLAVLLAGVLLGARDGAVAMATYVLAGSLGVPVFADGAGGLAHLVGPTAGYLLGFIAAAWGVGRMAERGRLRRLAPAVAIMLGAHALVLLLGWLRLSASLGAAAAFTAGVGPFLAGGVVKSLVAAGAAVLLARRDLTLSGPGSPRGRPDPRSPAPPRPHGSPRDRAERASR